ncbi:dynamin family protein [Massilia sp. TS11]|uniref:dynamin family protein n=1 Tax=Massilia sp. TS11 TaxID=2908003 RepID=UPI001EDC0A2A|nr:dynamin family protein [Massilia sp. TS11]MCG2584917.1 dynamin family protein [Massilia sp. TS11]
MIQDFERYSAWRRGVVEALARYRDFVAAHQLLDGALEQRIARALARLADDKLAVAFVAEFSRGKSELINAIFFAEYGQRILPSSAGRTTMCPTELLYDPNEAPSLRLLPIETRAAALSTSDYRSRPEAWVSFPLSLNAADAMQQTFREVSRTRRVSQDEAASYGLFDAEDPDHQAALDSAGQVEISQWRHAIINFPHPLLKQGLVIIDTPGLNAIGTEPELTLNLIPNAHAVLFILGAETGVTKSDIEVWRQHIGGGKGRIAVLNKIDTMWDELRSADEINADIARQQASVAQTLGLETRQVFPVSAQKALVAKINHAPALLAKSRLPALEAALFDELIPAKQDIIRKQLADDMAALLATQQTMIGARERELVEQLQELTGLRGKNQAMVAHMMKRVEAEKKEFDASLFKLQGTRAVFTRLSTELYSTLGLDGLQARVDSVRAAMEKSRFTGGMRDAVRQFFKEINIHLEASSAKVQEIRGMMDSMYRKFAAEHGLSLHTPMPFTLDDYHAELASIEAIYHKQFGTVAMVTTSRSVLMERFFDSIASRVRQTFEAANSDVEAWLKVIMAPLEGQIRQHKEQLKQRLASIQRIHDATDSLEQKIEAFGASQRALERLRSELAAAAGAVSIALHTQITALEVPA